MGEHTEEDTEEDLKYGEAESAHTLTFEK